MSFLLNSVIKFATGTTGPHKANPPSDDIKEINDSIWELYSPSRASPPLPHNVDIIFFHGLQLGDFEDAFWKTWRSIDDEKVVWPKEWLSKKIPTARIFSASYNTSPVRPDGQLDMEALGGILVGDIIDSSKDIGQNCQVFLVGHSLGGIVIKQFVISARKILQSFAENGNYQTKRDKITRFLNNLNGIFYYATPHDGSEVADMQMTDIAGKLTGGSRILSLLKTLDGTERVRINYSFEHHKKNMRQLRAYAVAEGMKTSCKGVSVMVVPEASALQDIDESYVNPKANHFTVCQAAHEDDDKVIGKLVQFIQFSLPASIV